MLREAAETSSMQPFNEARELGEGMKRPSTIPETLAPFTLQLIDWPENGIKHGAVGSKG